MVTTVPDDSRVQDRVVLGETLGITRDDPDYYALRLGNSVLGGAFYSTRLSRDLRKKAGLVYSVSSTLEIGRTRGLYFVDYACDPGNVSRVHKAVARRAAGHADRSVGGDELQRAKALLLREASLDEASFEAVADGLIHRTEMKLPLDEPTRAARRYLALGPAELRGPPSPNGCGRPISSRSARGRNRSRRRRRERRRKPL